MAGRSVDVTALAADVTLRPIGPEAEALFPADAMARPGHRDGLVARRDGTIVGGVLTTSRDIAVDGQRRPVIQILAVRTTAASLGPPLLEAACRHCAPEDAIAAIDETGTATAWQSLGPQKTVLRVHRPAAAFDLAGGAVLDRCVRIGVGLADRARSLANDVRRSLDVTPVDVVSLNGVPADLLSQLHATNQTRGVRFARDQETFEQLAAEDSRRYRTYVGYRHGSPVGAALVELTDAVILADIAPSEFGRTKPTVLDAILRAVLTEQQDVPLVRSTAAVLGRSHQLRWGFADDDRIPLRWWWSSPTRSIRSLDPSRGLHIGRYALDDPDDWYITPLDVG